jgi:Domain of Unknown Function (DUF1080)
MNRWSSITVVLLVIAFTGFGCTGQQPGREDAGWITLLDGASGLENWNRVGDANWRAEDGVIHADRKTDKASSFLMTKNSYADFQMRVEFWVSDDANSGIYMRCSDLKNITDKTCYEANIFDQRPDPTYGTGAIVHIAPISPMPKAGGKWNTYEITAKGTRLTVTLNGVRTADASDDKFASGPVGLQYAAGVVKFRKVQIKPL